MLARDEASPTTVDHCHRLTRSPSNLSTLYRWITLPISSVEFYVKVLFTVAVMTDVCIWKMRSVKRMDLFHDPEYRVGLSETTRHCTGERPGVGGPGGR